MANQNRKTSHILETHGGIRGLEREVEYRQSPTRPLRLDPDLVRTILADTQTRLPKDVEDRIYSGQIGVNPSQLAKITIGLIKGEEKPGGYTIPELINMARKHAGKEG